MHKKVLMVFIAMTGITGTYAQDTPMKALPLQDMSAFKQQAGNWQIVGDVTIDPTIDIHHEPEKAAAETGKKKKKSKEESASKAPQAVTFTAGKGVLLNMNDESKKDNLISAFEHGDIELELEVMLPKGSNSGIYLQGRYEVQLLDSWGVKNPSFSDIGGIYRNWESEPSKIYMGKAPLSNPAKAPGLWQKMTISFRAPKFDANGNKITNARFVSVELNGVKIHDNVEVPLPTGGPVENNEKPTGPLMIQGDHGPVAFRNVRYKLMKDSKVSVSDVSYKAFKGTFGEVDDFATLKPVKSGTSPELTAEVLDDENMYGIIYTGKVTIPEDETYYFDLSYTGGITFSINNQRLIDEQRADGGGRNRATIALKAGTYPFEIANFKTASWMPPRIGFTAQTASTYPVVLNAYGSFPPDDEPTSPILIHAGAEPKLLRAFIDFKGDERQRLTHTIGVGDPARINYVYDLAAGNLACVWRGDFVNATPMWHDRGDGSFRPLGAVQYLYINQPLAFLANANEAFPATGKEGEFRSKGYTIEETTARPVFKYTYQGLEVEDKVYPEDQARSITHEVTIKNRGTKTGLYYKLAEGSSITLNPNGSYAIDDKQYYIKTSSAATIRDVNGKKELIVAVDGSSVKYSIIW
ncbi:family 16 glycoside hydrolase [Ohtaekwangia koreensis]|uniref:PA14 domain-containing protein n=1 Tax=Ohtaekwangia koreensis TaxID=688867 RepID=A0A1T5LMQ4_9BACT|nr:family 16 glycoside hydrolase [Ohtaekwangia koreensis]SKC76819.1 PA14 domain-containing protein [Ohtaekwangia koreensis]